MKEKIKLYGLRKSEMLAVLKLVRDEARRSDTRAKKKKASDAFIAAYKKERDSVIIVESYVDSVTRELFIILSDGRTIRKSATWFVSVAEMASFASAIKGQNFKHVFADE